MEENKNDSVPDIAVASPFAQTYFQDTKTDLNIGDFIEPGINSNYGQRKIKTSLTKCPHNIQSCYFREKFIILKSSQLRMVLDTVNTKALLPSTIGFVNLLISLHK